LWSRVYDTKLGIGTNDEATNPQTNRNRDLQCRPGGVLEKRTGPFEESEEGSSELLESGDAGLDERRRRRACD